MRSEIFRARVEAQPDNLLFRFSLGQALFQEGHAEEAVTHLAQCAAGRSDWMIPRIILGKTCLQLGRKDEARRWLYEALDLAQAQAHEAPADECRQLIAELGQQ